MHQELRERFIARLCLAPFKAKKTEETTQQRRIIPRQASTLQKFMEKNLRDVATPFRNTELSSPENNAPKIEDKTNPISPKTKD